MDVVGFSETGWVHPFVASVITEVQTQLEQELKAIEVGLRLANQLEIKNVAVASD